MRVAFGALSLCSGICAAMLGPVAPASATTFTVTSSDGSGSVAVAGSLAKAISDANNSPGSTITFDPAVTSITLSGALPSISETVTIQGISGSPVTISGAGGRPIFVAATSAGRLTLSDLVLTNGKESSGSEMTGGGAVQVITTSLIVRNCTFTSNGATAAGKYVRGGAIYGSASPISVSNSTFTGNTATVTGSGSAREASGGAISSLNGTVAISDSTFTSNSATSSTGDALGGAVFADGASVTISGSTTFASNAASGASRSGSATTVGGSGSGGAVAVRGSTRSLTVTGATFTSNTASGGAASTAGSPASGSTFQGGTGQGGALWSSGSITVNSGAGFTANLAQGGDSSIAATGYGTAEGGFAYGGAIHVEGAGVGSSLTVAGATFTSNTARAGTVTNAISPAAPFSPSAYIGDAWGGAILLTGGSAAVTDTTFTGNAVDGRTRSSAGNLLSGGVYGGAVMVNPPTGLSLTVSVSSSTFSGNAANREMAPGTPDVSTRLGGGLYATGPGSLTIANSTFTANSGTLGAAIGLTDPAPMSTVLRNLTIAGNLSGPTNSALAVDWVGTTLSNSIVSGNDATDPCNATPATDLTVTTSLIDSGVCGTPGAGVIADDPLLGALGSNGGPTQTMALGAGSPALLTADSATCQAAPVSGVDQRGVARPAGRCDMGAYQRSEALPTPGGGGGGGGGEAPSPSSPTSSATPSAVAGPACSVTDVRSRTGDRTVVVSWRVTGTGCATTATATPLARATPPGPVSCTSTGSGCTITGLIPGVRYAVSVVTRGASDAATSSSSDGMITAVRYVREYTVVPFTAGSARVDGAGQRAIRLAMRGDVVEAKIVGYADAGSRTRRPLANARAVSVKAIAVRAHADMRVEAGPGALRNRRCAAVDHRCAVIRVTKAVNS